MGCFSRSTETFPLSKKVQKKPLRDWGGGGGGGWALGAGEARIYSYEAADSPELGKPEQGSRRRSARRGVFSDQIRNGVGVGADGAWRPGKRNRARKRPSRTGSETVSETGHMDHDGNEAAFKIGERWRARAMRRHQPLPPPSPAAVAAGITKRTDSPSSLVSSPHTLSPSFYGTLFCASSLRLRAA